MGWLAHRGPPTLRWRLRLIFCFVLIALDLGLAAEKPETPDLTEVSLEELMGIQVTSVSKLPEKRATAAAALYVITGEDIDRSGATSIPEALRMAPGVHVAHIDSSRWAVSVRGFGGEFTNKLLVLSDGRSVYTPLFGGVFWDVQDTLLDDIDRIEVIRGPGGALWGANAVNGVINIMTKSARATHGALVSAGGGQEERDFVGLRYGGQLGSGFHYRLYGKYFERDGGFDPEGQSLDDWHMGRLGFRSDWDLTTRDAFTVQGDIYDGAVEQLQFSPSPSPRETADLAGGNLLTRWRHAFHERSDLALQVYYDRATRDDPSFSDDQDTADVDLQYRLPLFGRQEILWGVGYRLTADRFRGSSIIDLVPRTRRTQLVNSFVQDQIPLAGDQLRLTLGLKVERNDFTDFELQPSGRLAWAPNERHTFWGAVSRAVRTPSRADSDLLITAADPQTGTTFELLGNRDLRAEDLVAFEAGYRVRPARALLLDVAGFYNVYDNLVTFETEAPFSRQTAEGEETVIRLTGGNRMTGKVYGGEIAADLIPTDVWRLNASYSLLRVDLDVEPGSTDQSSESQEKASPRHQARFGSLLDLPGNLRLDLFFRYVDSLPVPGSRTSSYVTMDARFAWLPLKSLELSVTGQNLAEDHHEEFAGGTEVQRGIYGKIRWRH